MSVLRSPNMLHDSAKEIMLDGKAPESHDDWVKVVNFYAANVSVEVQPACILFLATLYDCPLTTDEITAISNFQCQESIRQS